MTVGRHTAPRDRAQSVRNVFSTVCLVAGTVLLLLSAYWALKHPVLNLFIEPNVVYDEYDREVWRIDRDELEPLMSDMEANWNGTLSEWQPNYLIAHDWSDYGQMILSRPQLIWFDGSLYQYADEREVNQDAPGDVVSWALADEALACQTCLDGTNVVVLRYEYLYDTTALDG